MSGAGTRAQAQPAPEVSRGGRPRDPALDAAIITATRDRLVRDGFTTMTISDIAADAGVSRPTIYRRWATKLELTVDALDWGFRAQRDSYPVADLMRLGAREAFTEAVRRTDPCYFNPDAMVLVGNFMGETLRTPELLAEFRRHAVEPRMELIETVLADLQKRGDVRGDVNRHAIATLCFGSYYAAFLRGERDRHAVADLVVTVLWPALVTPQK